MLFQNSIGIEIRTESFSVIALKDGVKGIRVAAHSTVAFDSELNLNDKVKIIADIVNELSKQQGMGLAEIFVAIPREYVIVREIEFPISVKENLRTTLRYEMPKYVPLPVEEIYYDYLIIEENRTQNTLRILLFVTRKRDLDVYLPLAAHFGRNLCGIEIGATAVAGFLEIQGQGKGQGGWGVIQAGRKTGEISIYRGGILEYSKIVQSMDADGDLATGLAASVEAINNQHSGRDGSLKWICYNLPGSDSIDGRLREKLSLDITPLNDGDFALPSPDMAPAYGLALKGMRDIATKVNLLPEKMRRKPSRSGYYIMLVLILLVLVSAASWAGSRIVRYRMAISRVTSELAGLQVEAKEIESMVRQCESLEQQIQTISQLRQQRVSTLLILQELSKRIPPTAWIQEFSFQKGNVQITGLAESAREIVEVLEDSPVFADVVFLSAITKSNDGKERFRIGMGLQ